MTTVKGNQDFDLAYGHHAIRLETPFPVLVSLNDEPQKVCLPGSNKLVVKGEGKLSFNPTDKGPFHFTVTTRLTQKGEKFDDIPPPEPAPADNYLQILRQHVRQAMGITRENFADQRTVYEMGDYEVFEEDRTPTPSKDDSPTPEASQSLSEGTEAPGDPQSPEGADASAD